MHQPFGKLVIADIWDVDPKDLNDKDLLEHIMEQAVKVAGATIVGRRFNRFKPQGITGVLILSESHLSIHTYPEHGFIAIDCFTCGDHTRPDIAVRYMHTLLGGTMGKFEVIERGRRINS